MTTWVFIRGLMRESRHWGDFPELFKSMTGEQNIVLMDFPGNGSLHKQNSACSIGEMVDHARTQLKLQGYAPPYNLLAISLGAMVAVAWSERHVSEIKKMVLINTSLAPYNPFYHRLRPKNYPALLRLLYASANQCEKLILRLTSARYQIETMHPKLEQWTAYAREYPVSRVNILRQLYAAMSYQAASTPPAVAVLLLAGKHDQLVNTRCSEVLAHLWACELKIHPSAGHDLPLDDGKWIAQQVKEWQ